jgi:enoyl-CoA hydratase
MALDKKIINDALVHQNGINPVRDAMALSYLFTTEDTREGIRAFMEKRSPRFDGR